MKYMHCLRKGKNFLNAEAGGIYTVKPGLFLSEALKINDGF
jgi:hypothetical protein